MSPQVDILIADDEPAICHLLRQSLEHEGYSTRFAANGPETLAAVERAPPDLILLDIYLPGMSGIEVLRELQRRAGGELQFGVIVITATGKESVLEEALRVGASDILTKPIDLNYLRLVVRTQLTLKPPRKGH
jgi:CheY-like chemotaxis protein